MLGDLKYWAMLGAILIALYLLLSHTTTDPILQTLTTGGVNGIKAFQGR